MVLTVVVSQLYGKKQMNFLTETEFSGAKKVLTSAALTYVAALASAIATIFRLLLVVNNGGRR